MVWYGCLPGSHMVFAGLMSSSEKRGSRTETGLGLSGISKALSRSETFLMAKQLEGDATGEDMNLLSSSESFQKDKIIFR